MATMDRAAARHGLRVKLKIRSYTGVNAWCDLRGNDGRGEWEDNVALRDLGGSSNCTSHGNTSPALISLAPKLPTP